MLQRLKLATFGFVSQFDEEELDVQKKAEITENVEDTVLDEPSEESLDDNKEIIGSEEEMNYPEEFF